MSNEIERDDEDRLPEDQIDPAANALDAVREKIDAFDFERAIQMMNVMEKVSTTGVMNSAISGLAGLALNEMNDEAKALRKEYQEAFEAATTERERLIAERQRREAEEQDEANQIRPASQARAHPQGNFDPTGGQPGRPRPQDQERPRGAGADALQNKTAPPDEVARRVPQDRPIPTPFTPSNDGRRV